MPKSFLKGWFGERYHSVFSRLRHWGLQGSFAIFDQGLFSGSNFVLNILLARWLSPAMYGSFSLAFAVYLFFSGFHNALILEPMSVFGTAKYSQNLKSYVLNQFVIHTIISVALSLFALSMGYVLLYFHLADILVLHAIISMCIFLPLMLLMWVARRACYVLGKASWAALGSLVYAVMLLLSVFIIHSSYSDSNMIFWFAAVGLASLIGSCMVIGLIWFGDFPILPSRLVWQGLIYEQWQFGKWIMLATLFYFLGSQIQVFFSASMLGLAAAGAFRSLQNLTLPMLQILAVITTMIFPSLTFEFARSNYKEVQRKSIQFTMIMVLISLIYELLLLVGAGWIDSNLYSGKYSEYVWLIPWIGLVPVVNAFVAGFSLMLRSLQKPHFYLIDKVIIAIVGSVSAFLFIRKWNVGGAVFSLISIEVTGLLVYYWLYRIWFPNSVENGSLT